ncbi:hypothetical protein [Streptomyces sp. NPDC048277]|uniref:hypothetical protein n=1 Tax=Streptomyces sp. NPDC048277 TaxID=3155027 RepID=UPI0033EBAEC0
MTDGLLYVLTDPGRVPTAEFHRWYDTDHAPRRLAVPGIRSGARYRAVDGASPQWMACYDVDLAALDSPAYLRLRSRSGYEQELVDRFEVLDRRVYELLEEHGGPPRPPGPAMLVSVALSSSDEDALQRWYTEEHIPLLHAVPGWRRSRRYRLRSGAGPHLLTLHDIDGPDVFDSPGYLRATTTARGARVRADVTARERRVYTLHNTVNAPGAAIS